MQQTEPPPTPWQFPDPEIAGEQDYLGEGADLEPGTLLAAYRRGIFPMPLTKRAGSPAWWSPARRGILPLDQLRVTKSLRKSCRRFEIRIDSAFEEVVHACSSIKRPGGWITSGIREAYIRLHELGWAHSVEAWSEDGQDGQDSEDSVDGKAGRGGKLVGGLYGVAIGGLFAGESMFHTERDASKVALVGLVESLQDSYGDARLLDLQWLTPHLASLGAVDLARADYVVRLEQALGLPLPKIFSDPAS